MTRPIEFSNGKTSLVFDQVKIELSRVWYSSRTYTAVAIDALDYEYNPDARTHSLRLPAARLQLAVG